MSRERDEAEVLRILESIEGAVVENGHFVYTSWNHGDIYINKDAIYPHIECILELSRRLALRFYNMGLKIEVVIGPEKGGIILAQWVALHLQELSGKKVLALYAEKDKDGNFVIRRGHEKLIAGKRTLIVEDIIDTGKSVRGVVDAACILDARIVGVGALWNRGGVGYDAIGPGIQSFESLVDVELPLFPEGGCPLCKEGRPVNTSLGKGREFLEKKREAGKPA